MLLCGLYVGARQSEARTGLTDTRQQYGQGVQDRFTGLSEAIESGQFTQDQLAVFWSGQIIGISVLFIFVLFIVMFFYILGSLYNDRKDQKGPHNSGA